MDDQVCLVVPAGFVFIDKNKFVSTVIVNQTGGGVYGEGSAANDKHIGIGNVRNGFFLQIGVQSLLVENDVRFYDTAAFTMGNPLLCKDRFQRVKMMAVHTVISQDGTMQL